MPTTNPYLFQGLIYQCHRAQDADAANAFMAANPGWGLLDETPEGICYIARMDDKGVRDDLAKPEGLSELGSKAYDVIRSYIDKHALGYTGGCKAFYSPAEWLAEHAEHWNPGVILIQRRCVYLIDTIQTLFLPDIRLVDSMFRMFRTRRVDNILEAAGECLVNLTGRFSTPGVFCLLFAHLLADQSVQFGRSIQI